MMFGKKAGFDSDRSTLNSASSTHPLGDLRQVTALSTHLLTTTFKSTVSQCCWRLEVLSYGCESEKHIS